MISSKRARPDLHMHSSRSDGTLSPRALVQFAADRGVTVMALTDHDTLQGADELAAWAECPIPVIGGVELSIDGMRGLHLLGYGSGEAMALRRRLDGLAEMRRHRAQAMLDKLAALGWPIDREALPMTGIIGRAHIARAMVDSGYTATVQEAFDRFLAEGAPAYVAGDRLTMAEALALLRQEGFVSVVAHPALLDKDDVTLEALLRSWKAQGLLGVEVYHPSRAQAGYPQLERMARRLGLLVTGGSDFHMPGDTHGMPGCTAEAWADPSRDLDALMAAMKP